MPVGAFLLFYGLLNLFLVAFIGVVVLVVAAAVYYQDLFAHRKKKTGTL